MSNRWKRMVVVVGIGFGLAGLFWLANQRRSDAPSAAAENRPTLTANVDREVIRRQPYPRFWRIAATVRPREVASLSAEVTARVTYVAVNLGDSVRAGQRLVTLDAAVPTAGLATSQAEVEALRNATEAIRRRIEAAEANLRGARAEHDLSQTLYERQEKLFATGDVPRQNRDIAEGRLKAAEAALEAAERQLAAERAELARAEAQVAVGQQRQRQAETQVAQTEIVAPFTGRIAARLVDPGALAAPGVPLLVLESVGALRAVAEVETEPARTLHLGQTLQVELPGGEFVEGKLVEQSPAADPVTRTVTIKVELPPTASAHSGMFARVVIPRDLRDVLTVPAAAVTEQGGLQSVLVVEADGIVRRRIITVGERLGDRLEVLTGLREGETIVFGHTELRDGVRLVAP
ncbi:MAG: efflux RND transporter periplasmic adaptor subunit [Acidobacteriota bacterium]